MNLEALLDDLEAKYSELQGSPESLSSRKPVGYSRVTFGRDHYSGLALDDDSWHLVPFHGSSIIATEAGNSEVTNLTISRTCQRIIGLWVRVIIERQTIQGRLVSLESHLLLFREFCIPITSIRRIELHAVDNLGDE